MLEWITDNIGSIIVILLLAAIVTLICIKLVRDKKRGKSSCGCNCGHCALSGQCHKKER